MAAEAAGWGFVAGRFGLTTTLIAASGGMMINIVLARVLRLTAFRTAMRGVREIRERDGAIHWGIFQSLSEPTLQIENYLLSSWAEYERLVGRGVVSDGPVLAAAEQFHAGEAAPRSNRFLGHHFRLFHTT